jgi:hypothetical protein
MNSLKLLPKHSEVSEQLGRIPCAGCFGDVVKEAVGLGPHIRRKSSNFLCFCQQLCTGRIKCRLGKTPQMLNILALQQSNSETTGFGQESE